MAKYYITTAIDYVNSSPHIGTAYEKIAADVLARFHRLAGDEVRFQMGNDEHSVNVKKAAIEAGLDPKKYCDMMEEKFLSAWKTLNISYDGFIRTTDPVHLKAVQKLYQILIDNGDIYEAIYEGWYCESCEAFLTDKDLLDGKCPNHKTKPRWLKEENYFFALSKYQEKLLKHIKAHPEFILPEVRRNEVVKMMEMGLNDISVSRASAEWGIPLSHDPSHVVYVWVDALINYISAIGYETDKKAFKKWWPANAHVIGKDIIRFHCVLWPAMLMSAKIPLPKTIFAHGFVTLNGEKMSKSLGNVVEPLDITKRYGEDPLRYYLLRDVPFGKDTDFTWSHFTNRYNGDLANGVGNLISRTAGMVGRYLSGEIPAFKKSSGPGDVELKEKILGVPANVSDALKMNDGGVQFNTALATIWEGITAADKYINENKPWELQKSGDAERIRTVISNVAEAIRIVTVLISPFMPKTAEKIWAQMGFDAISRLSEQNLKTVSKWGFLTKAINVGPAENLFPRIEEKEEDKKMDKPVVTEPCHPERPAGAKDLPLIDISDFARVDLRIAEILKAERVEGADKLLKLQINIGDEERQIVAGIAKSYAPEELTGRKIVVVANLKPAKIRGIESNGMLLAASGGDIVSILTPVKDVPAGSKIK